MIRVPHRGDIRIAKRHQFGGAVQVSWQTSSGEMKTIRAKCTDLSEQGARIECESPIDFRTNVYLQAPDYGLMGTASVRYCRRIGMKHTIGLLFSAAASQAEQGRKRLSRVRPGAEK